MGGVINIIIGVVFIVGGLSGRLALIGTNNGIALAVVGVGLVGLGLFRLVTNKPPATENRRIPPPSPPGQEPWNHIQ